MHSDWDSIQEVDPTHFAVDVRLVRWNQQLKKFCELMGIPFQKPKCLKIGCDEEAADALTSALAFAGRDLRERY